MLRSSEVQVEGYCPICAMNHRYRVRVEQSFIDDNMFSLMNVRKPGDRTFRAELFCVRSRDPIVTEVRLYETLHRRTEAIYVRDPRPGGGDITAWSRGDATTQNTSAPRRHWWYQFVLRQGRAEAR